MFEGVRRTKQPQPPRWAFDAVLALGLLAAVGLMLFAVFFGWPP
jgi:hypothetical protein